MDLSLLTAAVDIGSLTEVVLAVGAVMLGIALVSLAVREVRFAIDSRRAEQREFDYYEHTEASRRAQEEYARSGLYDDE